MRRQAFWSLLKETLAEWQDDQAPRLGAALAYYTTFSLAPLVVIVVAVAGLAFGREAAQGQLVDQIQSLVGRQAAEAIQGMIQSASQPASGVLGAVVGVVMLLFSASGVFGELQSSLNTIWDVRAKPKGGFWPVIKDRFLSFSMVLGVGFLLLVSLVLSAALSAIGKFLGHLLPSMASAFLLHAVNFVVSFGIISLLFAVIYKVLPDVDNAWQDAWIGAIMTALLFTIGKTLIGFYLGRSSVASAYGAAGSLVIILLWVYYSAQILFFGADFTQVYARRSGSRVRAIAKATPLTEERATGGNEWAIAAPQLGEPVEPSPVPSERPRGSPRARPLKARLARAGLAALLGGGVALNLWRRRSGMTGRPRAA